MIVRPSPPEQPPELAWDLRREIRWTTRRRRLPYPQRSSGGRTRVCRARYYSRRFPFLHRLHHVELCRCLLRPHKTAEKVGLEIPRDNSDFRAAEEEFVGALVGTRMRQQSTCQRNCSKKMAEYLLKFYVIQQMRSTVIRARGIHEEMRFEYRSLNKNLNAPRSSEHPPV